MATIDEAVNNLSPEELDLLNSDPDMLAQFKAKYSQPSTPDYFHEPGLQDTSLTPITQPMLNEGGEQIATSKFGQKHPILGAAAGTAVAKAPEIALTASTLGDVPALAKSVSALGKTGIGRMFTAPLPKAAGKAIGEAESVAGINLSEEAVNAPRTRQSIVSFANRLRRVVNNGPEKLANAVDAKTLNSLKTQTGDILDYLKVAKQGAAPKQLVSKGTIARLSQIKDVLGSAVGQAEPAVGEALQNFAASKGRQAAVQSLGKAAKTAAKVAAIGVPGAAGLKYLFR